MCFPPSHPIPNHLYIAHPYLKNTYYPIEEYESQLFQSQIMELNYILQCLGAKTIISKNIKGYIDNKEYNSKANRVSEKEENIELDGNVKLIKADFSRDENSSIEEEDEIRIKRKEHRNKHMETEQHFSPKYTPYIPKDVLWYHHNDTWQNLAKQRLHGGLLKHEMLISTNNIKAINQNEKSLINKDIKELINIGGSNLFTNTKVSNNNNEKTRIEMIVDSVIENEDTYEQLISVEFVPIDLLTEKKPIEELQTKDLSVENNTLTKNEKQYMEFLEEIIDNNIIEEHFRPFLDKRLKRLKISKERGQELEKTAINTRISFTDNEEKYIEILEDMVQDGVIDTKMRTFLDKRAKRLELSINRVKVLEEYYFLR